MVKRTRIKNSDIASFAKLLQGWSTNETSHYFRQFWRSLGMSEMQFYRRIWMAQEQEESFQIEEIRKTIKGNRIYSRKRKQLDQWVEAVQHGASYGKE